MKRCPNCQSDNPVTSKYCSNCGTSLKGICPECWKQNKPDDKFCVECGASLVIIGEKEKLEDSDHRKPRRREAERRQLTILFCDLVGSTPLSEKLDPEEYRQVIKDYHEVAEKVVNRFGGHIAQYLGDGLLVYFGYPVGLEDAPRAGVQTGLGVIEAVHRANAQWKIEGKIPIQIRIGIHTGLVVVDDHLALGEAVNIAARLQGMAPLNGLVISPQTLKLVHGWFGVESMGKHELKGISQPMEIFRVLHESGAITRLDVAKSRGLSPLVGRQSELQIVLDQWKKAKTGNGNLVLLYGEAGIGKSRLVDTIEEQLSRKPDSWLITARCSAYQQNSAFHPVIEMYEKDLLRFDTNDNPEDKLVKLERFLLQSDMDLKTAMPLFAEFLFITSEQFPPLVMSPFAKRQMTFESLSQVLLSQTKRQPVFFVLEDLHWADASTLEWINMLLEQITEKNIFLLCTTRPGFEASWDGHPEIKKIILQRLTVEDLMNICHHQAQGKTLPKEILAQIAQKTEGVPLFAEELTKMIIESGQLLEKADAYVLKESLSSISIPSTLQDSLLARLDRLADAKEIVQVGAVLGREFSFEMLSAVLARKMDTLDKSLAQLLNAEIFYHVGIGHQAVYQFKHALIQDAAYESLLKSRRQQLHHRVANVLEHQFRETAESRPELLAHHFTEAGQQVQALPLWLKAGQQASQKNATSEAIAHLQKGIELLPVIKDDRERNNIELDFRLTLGGTYVVSHGFPHPKVRETFDHAREIAQNMEVNPKLALILFNLSSFYFNTEDYKALKELSDYMVELSKDPECGYWFDLASNQVLGFSGAVMGEFEKADRHFRRVIGLFDPSLPFPWELAPSGYIEVGAKAWSMICLQVMGKTDEGKKLFGQHLSFSKDHKDSMTLYHIYTFPALYSLIAREWKAAEDIMDTYLPIVKAFGDPIFTLTAEVYYYVARGFQEDRAAFDQAVNLINICFDVGFKAFAVTLSPFIGELFYHFGECESALNWIEKILDHATRMGSLINTAELYRVKGLTLEALGNSNRIVEENFEKALHLARKQSARTFELRAARDLALLWQKEGKNSEGYALLKGVYEVFKEGSDSVDLKEAREILEDLKR